MGVKTLPFRRQFVVFFLFLKQELNTGHLLSLNPNGIQVVPYMTLNVAMSVLLYKRANGIGYKTAKRRFAMEVRYLAIDMIVVQCGGGPKLFFKTLKNSDRYCFRPNRGAYAPRAASVRKPILFKYN